MALNASVSRHTRCLHAGTRERVRERERVRKHGRFRRVGDVKQLLLERPPWSGRWPS
jgi:hypothetical protein